MEREQVCLSACAEYDYDKIKAVIHEQLDVLRAEDCIRPGCRAVIKPNLVVRSDPGAAIATHPLFVAAVANELKERGAGSVMVAESPGGPYNPIALRSIYEGCGYQKMADEYGVALNFDCSYAPFETPHGQRSKLFQIINPILQADLVVDIAKLKSHCMMGLSGAAKNMFGAVPGLMKPELHCRFPEREPFAEMLVDLCSAIRPALSIVDGVIGMEGNGPSGGKPRWMGVVIASRNPFAADLLCARLANMKPSEVPMLKNAMERGLCPKRLEDVEIWGEDPEEHRMADFLQPESKSSDFLDSLPGFIRPFARKLATPVPKIRTSECIGCGKCAESCPQHTVQIREKKAVIDYKNCIRCYCCHEMCPKHVIDIKRLRLFGL